MWRKFLSRKFILAILVFIFGIVELVCPSCAELIDWKFAGPIIAYILGETGCDIMRAYIEWTYPKG